jgi:hypothetical protein
MLTTGSPRSMTLISLASLGSGYFIVKSRALADKQRDRAAGDYTVTVDRSGMILPYRLLSVDDASLSQTSRPWRRIHYADSRF